ncbi:hypothetical protein V1477_014418, partial [Vespula maculifrons]
KTLNNIKIPWDKLSHYYRLPRLLTRIIFRQFSATIIFRERHLTSSDDVSCAESIKIRKIVSHACPIGNLPSCLIKDNNNVGLSSYSVDVQKEKTTSRRISQENPISKGKPNLDPTFHTNLEYFRLRRIPDKIYRSSFSQNSRAFRAEAASGCRVAVEDSNTKPCTILKCFNDGYWALSVSLHYTVWASISLDFLMRPSAAQSR